jgi:hypothetical protein
MFIEPSLKFNYSQPGFINRSTPIQNSVQENFRYESDRAKSLAEGFIRNAILQYELVFGVLIPSHKADQINISQQHRGPSTSEMSRSSNQAWADLVDELRRISALHLSNMEDLSRKILRQLPQTNASKLAEPTISSVSRIQQDQLYLLGGIYFERWNKFCTAPEQSNGINYKGKLTDIFRNNEPVMIGVDYPRPLQIVDDLDPSFNKFTNFDKRKQPFPMSSEYQDAVGFFSKFEREEVILAGHRPSKVEVCPSARKIYFAGDVVGYLEQHLGKVGRHAPMYNMKSCTLKTLQQDEVLINDFQTWDLILFDHELQEKGRLQANSDQDSCNSSTLHVKTGPPQLYKSIYTRISADDRFIIWLKSSRDIAVVELASLTSQVYKDFWVVQQTPLLNMATPVATLLTSDGKRIFGLGERKSVSIGSNNIQSFHMIDRDGRLVIADTEKIFPKDGRLVSSLYS